MQEARIEEWRVEWDDWRGTHLSGYVFGHPRFADGTHVVTSTIKSEIPEEGLQEGAVVTTRNTYYTLGKKLVEKRTD